MALNGHISIRQQAEDGGPGRESHPDITNAQLERLCKCSPVLERHWLRLQRNLDPTMHPTRRYTWSLSSPDVDGGAIRIVFEKVSNPREDSEWLKTVTDVKSLSRYCGAFWHLNIVPDRLPSYKEWKGHASIRSQDILDHGTPLSTPTASSSQVQPTASSSQVQPTASSSQIHRRGAPSGSSITTQSSNSEGITERLNTSLATAQAALVLGQESRFKEEIKFVLEAMPGDHLEERPTPIKLLRLENLKGSSDKVMGRLDRMGKMAEAFRGSSAEPVARRMFEVLDVYTSDQLQGAADTIWKWRNSKVMKWEAILATDHLNVINYFDIDARTVGSGDY
ncbi:hypothetical protein B0T16DRAFT_501622 [Cercophora newfieldiana]|uniref:Uncharacterized protein n=1 Tax=Cercophora newfieldiana TaxID=92897 RepID=A0AA39YQS6_9PEZI|nr:hypothetical protein B0T16DRAFT_501622 [Cercophora newfieldiana]